MPLPNPYERGKTLLFSPIMLSSGGFRQTLFKWFRLKKRVLIVDDGKLARDLDESTLVIDCDFKCPNLSNMLGLSQEPGLAEYFAGVEPLEACLQHMPDMPLWCIAVGNASRYPVPFSKLQHLSTIVEQMKSRYRFIILDGPPVLPLADVNVLSELAHIVLLVVRSGSTPKDVVQKAFEMIYHTGPTRLVLNDAWTQGVPYYAREGYLIPYSLSSPG